MSKKLHPGVKMAHRQNALVEAAQIAAQTFAEANGQFVEDQISTLIDHENCIHELKRDLRLARQDFVVLANIVAQALETLPPLDGEGENALCLGLSTLKDKIESYGPENSPSGDLPEQPVFGVIDGDKKEEGACHE